MEPNDESELWCTRRQLDRLSQARLDHQFTERERQEYNALVRREAELLGLTLQSTG
jgi:hypothetical protein